MQNLGCPQFVHIKILLKCRNLNPEARRNKIIDNVIYVHFLFLLECNTSKLICKLTIPNVFGFYGKIVILQIVTKQNEREAHFL